MPEDRQLVFFASFVLRLKPAQISTLRSVA
jgi:hypothetical protein